MFPIGPPLPLQDPLPVWLVPRQPRSFPNPSMPGWSWSQKRKGHIMATIGTFKKTDNGEYVGDIVTLSVQTKGVRIVSAENPPSETAPPPRILVGRADIGAAWTTQSNEIHTNHGLTPADPLYPHTLYANPHNQSAATH